MVYQRRKHLINLFMWPSAGSDSANGKALSQKGYNLIMWTQGGMTFCAVSDVGVNDLREFVQLIRKYLPQSLRGLQKTSMNRKNPF